MSQLEKLLSNRVEHRKLVRRSILGKYRLEKRVGRGGYCEVWKARDMVEGLWVALKIPLPDNNGKRDTQSLLREIRMVARLRHSHIMPVKNAELIDGYPVLATELSAGTLDDCSKPMGVRKLLSIVCQVLEGLAYAHSRKLVHCDVSPANIFLFDDGRAALGDFGIGKQVKGRAKTVDEFGTPGYVAPEQAYGRPTYRSDCFAVAVVLYEYMTGYLPRWPFYWPFKGYDRLKERTNNDFVKFVKKAMDIDPAKRFANAGTMLEALKEVMPSKLKKSMAIKVVNSRQKDWKVLRRQSFLKRYRKVFPVTTECCACGEPISEFMQICPWCGSEDNRFDETTMFTHVCPRCRSGMKPEWKYCPWCWGKGLEPQEKEDADQSISYHSRCKKCGGKVMRFMKYCPWCHAKIRKKWDVWPFPEKCGSCGWSVDSNYWSYCPWCRHIIV